MEHAWRLPQPLKRALRPANLGLELALRLTRVFSGVAAEPKAVGARALGLIERLQGMLTAAHGVGDTSALERVGHRFGLFARRGSFALRRIRLAARAG